MELKVAIQIQELWGDQTFKKDQWGFINFLVGPNGTGKTIFAERLQAQCKGQGLVPRYLSAERLAGFEKRQYGIFQYSNIDRGMNIDQYASYKSEGANYGVATDAFVTLKEKLDVRIRIEASLSYLFGRSIRLAEEGGFLKPKAQKIGGSEYDLKQNECHGLKELISLFTFLYNDDYSCLIIDEPELHLHPQFQTLFLEEIRKVAGDPRIDPSKKCFFLITHSPYCVDIRTVDDLRHCVVFHPNGLPSYIDQLDTEDEYQVRRLLPRLNTHHKQFFFASRPIFVEGYTDQQIFTLIQEKRGKMLGASGACVIDVGGKDELDLFFRLCKRLNIEAQLISDLDALLQGKLRQSVSQDDRCRCHLQEQGVGTDLLNPLGELESAVDDCLTEIEAALASKSICDSSLGVFRRELTQVGDEVGKRRYIFLVALKLLQGQIRSLLPQNSDKLGLIEGRLLRILEAFQRCGVHLLPKGELENYLPSYDGNAYAVPDDVRTKVFNMERDFILTNDLPDEVARSRYGELITILDEACPSNVLNMDAHLNSTIGDWMHKVQRAVLNGEAQDKESLERNALVEWPTHSRIFELLEFSLAQSPAGTRKDSLGFTCKLRLKPLIDPGEREFVFDHTTQAASYKLAPRTSQH